MVPEVSGPDFPDWPPERKGAIDNWPSGRVRFAVMRHDLVNGKKLKVDGAAAKVVPFKPAGIRELSPRAIICGLSVAAIMGASYPYIVLKLGFGPNVSV